MPVPGMPKLVVLKALYGVSVDMRSSSVKSAGGGSSCSAIGVLARPSSPWHTAHTASYCFFPSSSEGGRFGACTRRCSFAMAFASAPHSGTTSSAGRPATMTAWSASARARYAAPSACAAWSCFTTSSAKPRCSSSSAASPVASALA